MKPAPRGGGNRGGNESGSARAPRLDALIRERHGVSWGQARGWIETGKVFVAGQAVTDPGAPVDPASAIELRMNAPRARAGGGRAAASGGTASVLAAEPRIVYSDSQIVVVDKPSGMSSVPFEQGETGSLEQWVARELRQPRVTVVHRLDRETSGLLVFARSAEAGRALAQQFRFHTVHRRYLALAHGTVESRTIRTHLVEDRGDGLRGSAPRGRAYARDEMKEAITHVETLAELDGMTLVECRLETGRTHQIRIHLSEAGHPLVGERLYIREFAGERIPASRLMLHAAELGIEHPTRRAPMIWSTPPPEEFLRLLPIETRRRWGGDKSQ